VSLVEQTIARLKKEQGQSATNDPANRALRATPSSETEQLDETANSNSVNRISVDLEALRAAGYLPEPEKERQFADQYRRIKRPLIDKALSGDSEAGDPRLIMVSSALPGDGKTFTSLNLALSMSLERDISVLLIDADVAKRHVSQIFGLDAKPGLLDVLADERQEIGSVVLPTTNRGLSILPAGGRIANTAELLSSARMGKIMASLCARNPRRILLLDSSPLLITNEGRALVKLVGQVVLVVRAGQTPRQAVQAAVALFDANQAGGVVLNQVPGASTDEYYGYGSYGADGAQT
jgi:protein-tyrosine kinase